MENQTAEVEAIVDKFMSVKLKIPKQIDAGELLSITQRLHKILKISPLPSDLKKSGNHAKAKEGDARKGKYDFLNEKSKAIEVLTKLKTANKEEKGKIAEGYGLTNDQLNKSIYYAKKKFSITDQEIAE